MFSYGIHENHYLRGTTANASPNIILVVVIFAVTPSPTNCDSIEKVRGIERINVSLNEQLFYYLIHARTS